MTAMQSDRAIAPAGATDLLLLRLLATSPSSPKSIRADFEPYFPEAISTDQWEDLVQSVRAAGLVTRRGLRLTDAGRLSALAVIGVPSLPMDCTWRMLEAKYLAPLAVGHDPFTLEMEWTNEHLAARALADRMELLVPPAATLAQVFVAIIGKVLGFPDETDLQRLRRRALSRAAGSSVELTEAQLRDQLPRKLLDISAPGPGGLRARLIRDWLASRPDTGREEAADENGFDLGAFAATVRAAARHCPTGHFGGNRVYISHLWRYLQDESSVPRLDLTSFKARLVEAHAAALIELARADWITETTAADVRESEATHKSVTYHFVLAF